MTKYDEDIFYLLVFSIAMTNLRYTSFALDWVSAQKRAKQEVVTIKPKEMANTSENKPTDIISGTEKTKDDNPAIGSIPVISEPQSEKETDKSESLDNENKVEKDVENKLDGQSVSQDDNKTQGSKCEQPKSDSGSDPTKNLEQMTPNSLRGDKNKSEDFNPDETEVKYSIVDMFSYCLYLPYYFTGPITTYDEFYKQVSFNSHHRRLIF